MVRVDEPVTKAQPICLIVTSQDARRLHRGPCGKALAFMNNPGEFFVIGLLRSGHAITSLSGNPIVDLGSELLKGWGEHRNTVA